MATFAQKTSTLMKGAAPSASRSVAMPSLRPCTVRAFRSAFRKEMSGSRAATVQLRAAADPVAGWANQVKSGAVKTVRANEIGSMMNDGWTMLDVRPPGEVAKVSVVGSIQIPLYIEDPDRLTPSGLIKESLNLGMGGWWLGGGHLVPNGAFMGEVQAKIPKDARIIVGCQKGLRSLAACENLIRAGYTTVGWVNGGFDGCRKGDLPTSDDKDIRYGNVGGVGGFLGWTDVQREEGKQNLGGTSGVLTFFALILTCDFALFGYEYFKAFQQTGKLPWEL